MVEVEGREESFGKDRNMCASRTVVPVPIDISIERTMTMLSHSGYHDDFLSFI